ncbi:hypothetical protein CHLRE_12g525990v5 [Chlamydomonas reinhardtii]|uniref:Uncharacterized protein n=1 Tax=Chlamydomonas reinhardtii TaxID=3055 RepID=A0A2K3D4E4_CHLRE|nr:uncharacterized protein CHLRE_12g525990v5 [Chlamydomonas reinhardtii]PNW75410.1 hypothetical protein CHLRE_12g525990v5 [Chlamydomonas reinhardtii]
MVGQTVTFVASLVAWSAVRKCGTWSEALVRRLKSARGGPMSMPGPTLLVMAQPCHVSSTTLDCSRWARELIWLAAANQTHPRRRVIVRPGGHVSAAAAAQQRHAGVSAEADDEEVDVQAVEEEGAVATNTSRDCAKPAPGVEGATRH